MKLIYYILGLIYFGLLFGFKTTDKTHWKFEKNKNGIQVYSRLPEGESIKEIKIYTLVETTLSAALSVLKDVPNHPHWIFNCSETKLIQQINEQEMIFYTISDLPWPIEDRDLVVRNKIEQDYNTKIVRSISVPQLGLIPKKKGIIRVTDMYSEWKFTPRKNGLILIEYYLRLDPASNIPNSISNLLVETGPYRTMLNFKKAITLEKHKNATFTFINELTY